MFTLLLAVVMLAWNAATAIAASVPDVAPGETVEITEQTWNFLEGLTVPVRKWQKNIENEKNEDGKEYKSCSYSKTPRKVDDSTYIFTAHVNTAYRDHQLTERFELTVKGAGENWEIVDQKLVDQYIGLFRATGMSCAPFDKFDLDREGMKVSASHGSVCEAFFKGRASSFAVHADDLAYSYAPPAHAAMIPTGHDFYAQHELAKRTHGTELEFSPAAAFVSCDGQTCEQLLTQCFTGLQRAAPEEREKLDYDRSKVDDWIRPLVNDILDARKDNPFSGFRLLDLPGNRAFSVFVARELHDRDDGVQLAVNNWGVGGTGWEVVFSVWPKRFDLPNQLVGPIYGYFTEETVTNSDPYDLERRSGGLSRWLEVESIKGRVDLATLDAEKLQGDVEFGLVLKQDTDKLPFGIVSFDRGDDRGSGPKPITVNSIRIDGQEATWVKTGPTSGLAVLPGELSAGTKVKVRMQWESRTILKFTSSYSYMPRQGWMPFVRFGDLIDEFELTIRSPARYEILGVGHKVSEKIEGDVRVSTWTADMPVNFPTIIFGDYRSDTAGDRVVAKKLDGTPIPITVYVDKASFVSENIGPKTLRPLAGQAANSINLYEAMTGVDYPFGELNLVNDPAGPLLYGQAPSSIIYLGSGVFQNEGELAPYFLDATAISTFMKSVVSHEVGHQWWGNRVANANDRNYWFVESLAEYFSAIYMEYTYGWDAYQRKVEEWRRTILNSTLKGSVQNATTLFAGEWGGGMTGSPVTAAIYNKGPYALHMLRETFKGEGPRGDQGADKHFFEFLHQAFQELAQKREIVTLDIQQAAEKGLGGVDQSGNPYNVDLSWFFDQWIRGSGIPQYRFDWTLQPTEDGGYIIDGTVHQRVMLGQSGQVLDGQVYRGVVNLKVTGKGGPYIKRVVITEAATPVRVKVPVKPIEITINQDGEMLALDTAYNRPW